MSNNFVKRGGWKKKERAALEAVIGAAFVCALEEIMLEWAKENWSLSAVSTGDDETGVIIEECGAWITVATETGELIGTFTASEVGRLYSKAGSQLSVLVRALSDSLFVHGLEFDDDGELHLGSCKA